MTENSPKSIEEINADLASKLFEQEHQRVRANTDKLFAILLVIQWIGGFLAAYFVSPLTWAGTKSSIHPHIWASVLLGGLITAFPLFLLVTKPGAKANGYVVGVCQMLMSGLLIHLTGGRIETHFHIFGSLAFLAFYRDWRVLIPASIVTAADHMIRGWFYPASIYGVLTGAEWRWIEHAFWVAFENVFLIAACRQSVAEMKDGAMRSAHLNSSEARYRAVIEQSGDAIFLMDPDNLVITDFNEGLVKLIDSDEELIKQGVSLKEISAIDEPRFKEIVASLFRGEQINEETVFLTSSRKIVKVGLRMTMIEFGDRLAISATATDITFRKEAEMRLQEVNKDLEERVQIRTVEVRRAKEFFSTVLENLPLGVFVKDSRQRYILANNTAKEYFGIKGRMRSRARFEEFPNKFRSPEEVSSEDLRLLETGESVVIPEHVYRDADSNMRYCEIRKEVLEMHKGKSKYILGILHDYTARKAIESQLRQAQKLESIGQLAAGIAHEINTPTQFVGDNMRFVDESLEDIQSLLALFEGLLEKELNEDERQSLIEKIKQEIEDVDLDFLKEELPKAMSQSHEGVERISKIVESMRDFSHPGSDKMKAVDLNKAIISTVTVAKNQWKYVADLETDLDEHLPLVPCLIGEFNQVILNMIVNATHAIEEKNAIEPNSQGLIRVTTNVVDDDWVKISVTDSGNGMPDHVKAKIFDPFFTTKEVGKGTGQGLAISHNVIVEKHNGKIEVDSTEGEGTAFTIHMPLNPDTSQTEQGLNNE